MRFGGEENGACWLLSGARKARRQMLLSEIFIETKNVGLTKPVL
jgi:hypothetical protein